MFSLQTNRFCSIIVIILVASLIDLSRCGPLGLTSSSSTIDNSSQIRLKHHQHSPQTDQQVDYILGFELSPNVSILLRVTIFAYTCLVIGYLCDEFFVPSLVLIGKRRQWPNDLVASILIPLGTSGPEIFSSAIGVFFAQTEIGTGAIIGSAVFNILAIPAVCAIVALYIVGRSTPIDARPILRDLLFYVVTLIILIQCIRDNVIDLLDSLLLLMVFVIYMTYMFYRSKFAASDLAANAVALEKRLGATVTVSVGDSRRHPALSNPSSTTIAASTNSDSNNNHHNDNSSTWSSSKIDCFKESFNDLFEEFLSRIEPSRASKRAEKAGYEPLNHGHESSIESDSGFDMTQNPLLHILLLPFSILFSLTMFRRRWAYSNFAFSITWLSALSYVTIWAISGLSELLSIPPNIAGMTILAAGSAVPDLVTGIVVIKKTKKISMSICAAIASNSFAILLGLGLPWATQIAINLSTGEPAGIVIESGTLPITCMLLLGTVLIFYCILRVCNWQITYSFSALCVALFVLFIGANVTLEIGFDTQRTILTH